MPPPGGDYALVQENEPEPEPAPAEQVEQVERETLLGASGAPSLSEAVTADDAAGSSGGGLGACCRGPSPELKRTYEVAGEALRSIQQVAVKEWASGRALDQDELDRSTAVMNERLVRVMFEQWQPDYKIVGVRAFIGAHRNTTMRLPRLESRRLTVTARCRRGVCGG